MYVPEKFKIDDPKVIHTFIEENSFGLLLTTHENEIHDTHTPFVYCEKNNRLLGHIARANPQWEKWGRSSRGKVVFSGPHAYISPSYYASEFNVPTWNYNAVSVSGDIAIISDQGEVLDFLDVLVKKNEPENSGWTLNRDDERYMKLLSGIVVFSVSMNKIEASFKLNQNKSQEDQHSVIQALQETGCPFKAAVASLMSSDTK